jgi:arylsulfatase A-like enzyme
VINPNLGRDHWPNAWSLALTGGGIKTGLVLGATDEKGHNVTDRVVSMGDLYATVYKALGIDWRKEYMSPIGRPVKIANSLEDTTGEPVHELLG